MGSWHFYLHGKRSKSCKQQILRQGYPTGASRCGVGWGGRTVDLCHLFILHIDSSLSPDTDGINVPRVRHSFHLWFDSFRTICCSFVLSDLFFKRPPEGRPARHLPDATNPVRRLNEEWSARVKAKRLGGSLPRP